MLRDKGDLDYLAGAKKIKNPNNLKLEASDATTFAK